MDFCAGWQDGIFPCGLFCEISGSKGVYGPLQGGGQAEVVINGTDTPAETVKPTATADPTATIAPEATADPTATVAPEATADPSATVAPTKAPAETAAPTATPAA